MVNGKMMMILCQKKWLFKRNQKTLKWRRNASIHIHKPDWWGEIVFLLFKTKKYIEYQEVTAKYCSNQENTVIIKRKQRKSKENKENQEINWRLLTAFSLLYLQVFKMDSLADSSPTKLIMTPFYSFGPLFFWLIWINLNSSDVHLLSAHIHVYAWRCKVKKVSGFSSKMGIKSYTYIKGGGL